MIGNPPTASRDLLSVPSPSTAARTRDRHSRGTGGVPQIYTVSESVQEGPAHCAATAGRIYTKSVQESPAHCLEGSWRLSGCDFESSWRLLECSQRALGELLKLFPCPPEKLELRKSLIQAFGAASQGLLGCSVRPLRKAPGGLLVSSWSSQKPLDALLEVSRELLGNS